MAPMAPMAPPGVGRCAVLGDPVAHSLSPALHRAAYAELGLDWDYQAVRVPESGLAGFVAGLDASWRGLSVTMPLKREALALADDASDRARTAGAANTLVRRDHGWWADNTDVPGAAAAIRERTDRPLTHGVVLGGGATAASVGLALADLGCRRLDLLARDPARSEETRRVLAAHPSAPEVVVGRLDDPAALSADLVVSTVPASAQGADLVARVAQVPLVFEVLYAPWPTPLARAAVADGRTLVGGLDLLVHQAVVQVALCTGRSVPVAVLRAAGEVALAGRGA